MNTLYGVIIPFTTDTTEGDRLLEVVKSTESRITGITLYIIVLMCLLYIPYMSFYVQWT